MKSEYGLGQMPPYSLYEDESGKWGLVDGNGNKLPAVFNKIDESRFSSVLWEIVTFDEKEGFELQAWYDPCEAWFNFTWDDPAYPEEYGEYLWMKSKKEIEEYADTLYSLIPEESHWLIEELLKVKELERLDDRDFFLAIDAMLYSRPELIDASSANPLLDLVMRNNNVATDIKIALWNTKVSLDDHIRIYLEEYPDGY